ncbi:intraflagellar transport protein 46 homolog [Tetranychus urticae]|uniref:Intraflagellar transport protein 46 homolog n=1 Tax=Tetranychus urticae TaxID=32264 RepID=T1KD56_TETUR|nr:intraflagellar transport protein 46 homolog [Tetranychus urticae]
MSKIDLHPNKEEIDDEEDDDDEDDEEEDGEDEDEQAEIVGAYDPQEFKDLRVSSEVRNLFNYITLYSPQIIDLDMRLEPFIPDYIPAVGDIDGFIKVPRPDKVDDSLGLTVIDEPSSRNQSDPALLNLKLRTMGKEVTVKQSGSETIKTANSTKDIDSWIDSIKLLHETTASIATNIPLISSARLPDVEQLMQEWDPSVESALSNFNLPTAELDVTLDQYVTIICSLLDIPIHQSKIASLHLLFNLYYEFQNSQHFKQI